jgi:hypothetical protein
MSGADGYHGSMQAEAMSSTFETAVQLSRDQAVLVVPNPYTASDY